MLNVLLLLASPALADDAAILWRGFDIDGLYNHRLAHLGSWVNQTCTATGCTGTARTAAAGGAGEDEFDYVNEHTFLRHPDVGFQPGFTNLDLVGTEGVTASDTNTVSVTLDSNLRSKDNYAVVLNGFEIEAIEEAKAMDALTITVGTPTVVGNTIQFAVTASLLSDCDGMRFPECTEPATVDYDVRVKFLIIAGDSADFQATNDSYGGQSYSWDGPPGDSHGENWGANLANYTEISIGAKRTAQSITGDTGYDRGTVALRGFTINLNEEHHWVQMAVRVMNDTYSWSTGEVEFDQDVFFKNWETYMKNQGYGSGWSWGAAGDADFMNAQTVLLQFNGLTYYDHDATTAGTIVTTSSEEASDTISFP